MIKRLILLFFMLAGAAAAAPQKVYTPAKADRYAALFGKTAKGEANYEFVAVDRKNMQMLRPRLQFSLSYPDAKPSFEYSADIGIIVDSSGNIVDTCVVKSNDTAYGAAMAKQIEKWKFFPAKFKGKKVASFTIAPLTYLYTPKSSH